MDGKAYCSEEAWQANLNALGLDETELRDERYEQASMLAITTMTQSKFSWSLTHVLHSFTGSVFDDGS